VSIDTIDEEQRNALRRIYREIEGDPVQIYRKADGTAVPIDNLIKPRIGLPESIKPVEASPVAREALEMLLNRHVFVVVFRRNSDIPRTPPEIPEDPDSLPDFAKP
jgi:hypothetical protein